MWVLVILFQNVFFYCSNASKIKNKLFLVENVSFVSTAPMETFYVSMVTETLWSGSAVTPFSVT